MYRQKSLKANAVSNWAVLGSRILTSFFLTPALLKHLGEQDYGIWFLAMSVVGYFGILEFGMGTAILRFTPYYASRQETDKINSLVSSSLAYHCALGAVVICAGQAAAPWLASFFRGGPQFEALIRIAVVAAAFQFLASQLDALLRGFELHVRINTLLIIQAVARTAGLVLCILTGAGLIAMGCVVLAISVITFTGKLWLVRHYLKSICLGMRYVNIKAVMTLALFGAAICIEQVGAMLRAKSPEVIIGRAISLEIVGLYGIIALLIQYYRNVVWSASKVLLPRFSYLCGKGRQAEVRVLFINASRYVAVLAGLGTLLLWVVGPEFLVVWTGKARFHELRLVVLMLVTGYLVELSNRASTELLFGLGRERRLAVFSVVEGILVALLGITLFPFFGMVGIAAAIAGPFVLVRGILQVRLATRLLNMGAREYYVTCIIRPWVCAAVWACLIRVVGLSNLVTGWLSLITISVIATAGYCACIAMIVLTGKERGTLLGVLGRPLRLVGRR